MAAHMDTWQPIKEWGGWLFGAIATLLGVGKAANAKIDARAEAVYHKLINDPESLLHMQLTSLSNRIEDLVDLVRRIDPQRVDADSKRSHMVNSSHIHLRDK